MASNILYPIKSLLVGTLLLLSYFSGYQNKDLAFHHPRSKTLIVADLLFHLPANEQVLSSNSFSKLLCLIHHGMYNAVLQSASEAVPLRIPFGSDSIELVAPEVRVVGGCK